MSDANQVRVGYVFEVTPGTTPVDDAGWETLRVVSDSLDAVPTFGTSNEILSDRLRTGQRKFNDNIAGNITAELSEDSFDSWLEAVLQGTWATNVLKAGTTKRYMTIERWFQDIDVYQWFKGCQLNTLEMTINHDGFIIVNFGVMGQTSGTATSGNSLVGAGSIAAAATTSSFAGIDTSSIEIDGTETTLDIASITLSLTNNQYPITDLRVAGAAGHGSGFSDLTGTMTAYLADMSLRSKLDAQTNFDLKFVVTIGAKSFTFDMPTAGLTQAPIAIPGGNQAIMQDCQFAVFKDSGLGSNVTITRAT